MSKLFKPTTLYIKTHNVTGLKYFGKTTGNPHEYRGSGIYWTAHLRKHGYDVTTEVLGYYTDKDECTNAANLFSIENNIVKAVNEDNKKIWANQIIENGTDGGATWFGPRPREMVERIAARQRGVPKPLPPEVAKAAAEKGLATKARNGTFRKKGEWNFPEASKQKLRDANLGKKQSAETIKKRQAKLIGKKRSEEIKAKLRKPKSEQARANMKAAQQNKGPLSEKTKEKIKKARAKQQNVKSWGEQNQGMVIVINKEGMLSRIPKEQYYTQTGPKNDWEWLSHKSADAQARKLSRE